MKVTREGLNGAISSLGDMWPEVSRGLPPMSFQEWAIRLRVVFALLHFMDMHGGGEVRLEGLGPLWYSGDLSIDEVDKGLAQEAWAAVLNFCQAGAWPAGRVVLPGITAMVVDDVPETQSVVSATQ